MRGLDVTTMSFVIAGGFLLTFMALYGVFGGFFAERRQPFVRDRAYVEDEIVDVEAVTDKSPYQLCGGIAPDFKKLIGLRIGGGFNRAVRERLGGVHGCTHLVELLGPVATTAFQTTFPTRVRREAEAKRAPLPPGCNVRRTPAIVRS